MDIQKWIKELVTPPKTGQGSSGVGAGMVDSAARQIKKRNEEMKKVMKETK